ncbi:HAD hydrolase-like protein [Flavobacteriaceae bacterium]|jgi:phosphoglycolate phosphatase-like HAD superfamily hydrolase|nr:HAD hydrolase-like protein [Flavobacteriaceae bacterium]|tara:strand:+ start:3572 stop:4186 length:615 start_codon:yes stop_codon:yes gene_type:complete
MKNILWDFDGVILNSMKVRDWGFEEIFKNFDQELINELLIFHRKNGGLSRYVKIRYFYEKILSKSISKEKIDKYAESFSVLMKMELIKSENLILDSLDYIKTNHQKYNFHIVSGSDQLELRFLCKELKIAQYFNSIHGSPTPKNQLVSNLLDTYQYDKENTCLIGDSINDYEAAEYNEISFFNYNNNEIRSLGKEINSFKDFNY